MSVGEIVFFYLVGVGGWGLVVVGDWEEAIDVVRYVEGCMVDFTSWRKRRANHVHGRNRLQPLVKVGHGTTRKGKTELWKGRAWFVGKKDAKERKL